MGRRAERAAQMHCSLPIVLLGQDPGVAPLDWVCLSSVAVLSPQRQAGHPSDGGGQPWTQTRSAVKVAKWPVGHAGNWRLGVECLEEHAP